MCRGGGCCFCTAPYIGHHNDAALPVTTLTTTQHQACGADIRAEPLLMQIPQTRFCNIFASRPRDALLRTAGGCVEAELGQGQPRPHCVWRLGLVCLRLELEAGPHTGLHT